MKIASSSIERRLDKVEATVPRRVENPWWFEWLMPYERLYLAEKCYYGANLDDLIQHFIPRAEQRRQRITSRYWYSFGNTHFRFDIDLALPWSVEGEIEQIRAVIAKEWEFKKFIKLNLSQLTLDELEIVDSLRDSSICSPPRGTWVGIKYSGIPLDQISNAVSSTILISRGDMSYSVRSPVAWELIGRPLTLADLDLIPEDYLKLQQRALHH
jgi:hypothetical protein